MTRAELLARMSGPELDQWAAYERLEPWGEARADYRAGIVASVFYNMNKSEKAEPRIPRDFLPIWDAPPKGKASPADIRGKFLAAFPPSKAPKSWTPPAAMLKGAAKG